jgi:hypothetical protein
MPYTTRIKQTYIDLRAINLGAELINEYSLQSKQTYSIRILGANELTARGTLNQSNALSGLSTLYRNYDLQVGDEIQVSYENGQICITPPIGRLKATKTVSVQQPPPLGSNNPPAAIPSTPSNVFAKKNLKHIHIEAFAEMNFREWSPKTEADVYLVFGSVSEFTDYKYCCGASAELLDNLGYKADTKPDAIIIDRATSEYLIAEFKMFSSQFKGNHKKEDIDVLICWIDDEVDRTVLPPDVVGLSSLIENAIKDGDMEI